MYEARKQSRGGDRGNQYTVEAKGQNEPLPKSTAAQIAEEVGVSESTVKRAEKFSKGIDAIQSVSPEAAQKILKGGSGVTKQSVMELPQIEPEQVKEFADSIVSGEVKKQKRAEAQEIAELVTLSEVQLGRMLKEIPKVEHSGNQHTNHLETSAMHEESKTKTETIKELGFNRQQVSEFQRMADHEESKRESITTWANCRKS